MQRPRTPGTASYFLHAGSKSFSARRLRSTNLLIPPPAGQTLRKVAGYILAQSRRGRTARRRSQAIGTVIHVFHWHWAFAEPLRHWSFITPILLLLSFSSVPVRFHLYKCMNTTA